MEQMMFMKQQQMVQQSQSQETMFAFLLKTRQSQLTVGLRNGQVLTDGYKWSIEMYYMEHNNLQESKTTLSL